MAGTPASSRDGVAAGGSTTATSTAAVESQSRSEYPSAGAGSGSGSGGPGRRWQDDLAAALPVWVVARVLVALSVLVAHLVVNHVQPSGPSIAGHVGRGILGWDAEWYRNIAAHGYERLPAVGLRFFPLLPALARGLGWVLLGQVGLALLLVANAASLAYGALLHRLCLVETGDAAFARRAVWVAALVPSGFVLAWGYAEGLAGALAVGAFLGLRGRRWGWAAAAGLLAGLTRPVGVLLALPAAIEAARGVGAAGWRERAARAGAVGAPFAGAGLYLAWVGVRFGDPLLPFTVQAGPRFRGELTNPLVALWRAWIDLPDLDPRANGLHAPWATLAIVLVVLTFRRWPLSYFAFAGATVLVALSAARLGSFERYAFGAFPLVLTIAALARRPAAERAVLVAGGVAMTVYGTMALLGAYVP